MKKLKDLLFARVRHTCPWWLCFTFDNPLRKLFHDPQKILSPYVLKGSVVLDIGPGMGFFTIPMARMVGTNGRVVAADIQPQMLETLKKRANHHGVTDQVTTHLSKPDSLDLDMQADFILAFWMVHEVQDKQKFFRELQSILKPGGLMLIAEPVLHVSDKMFSNIASIALEAGFMIKERPEIRGSRAIILTRI